jgi:hypothetical protein
MQSKFKLKSSYIIFVLGNITGLVSLVSVEKFNTIPQPFKTVTFLLAQIGFILVKIIQWPICLLNPNNICRGLGLDGGPLVWMEWTGLFISVIIGYGFLFVCVYMLFKKMHS